MKRDARRLWLRVSAVIAAVAAVCLFYWAFDPEAHRWMPRCPFKALTGCDCMGCGSQRMIHALLHGDLAGAWHANALLLVSLPLLGFGVFVELTRTRHPRLYARVFSTRVIMATGVVLLLWTAVRNIVSF